MSVQGASPPRRSQAAGRGRKVSVQGARCKVQGVVLTLIFLLAPLTFHFAPLFFHLAPAWAAEGPTPSLFREVVVTDSPIGVRVVNVGENSQAYLADLRAEDILIRVHGQDVQSIDDFAATSLVLKGRHITETKIIVFRNGKPLNLTLHLYSYPLLRQWSLKFIPNSEMRFARPKIGREFWSRMGRGFEEADKPKEALDAYLNALHNDPEDAATGLKVSRLFWHIGRDALHEGAFPEGIDALSQGVIALQQLFNHPLSDEQLQTVKAQLEKTLAALRKVSILVTPGGTRAPFGVLQLIA